MGGENMPEANTNLLKIKHHNGTLSKIGKAEGSIQTIESGTYHDIKSFGKIVCYTPEFGYDDGTTIWFGDWNVDANPDGSGCITAIGSYCWAAGERLIKNRLVVNNQGEITEVYISNSYTRKNNEKNIKIWEKDNKNDQLLYEQLDDSDIIINGTVKGDEQGGYYEKTIYTDNSKVTLIQNGNRKNILKEKYQNGSKELYTVNFKEGQKIGTTQEKSKFIGDQYILAYVCNRSKLNNGKEVEREQECEVEPSWIISTISTIKFKSASIKVYVGDKNVSYYKCHVSEKIGPGDIRSKGVGDFTGRVDLYEDGKVEFSEPIEREGYPRYFSKVTITPAGGHPVTKDYTNAENPPKETYVTAPGEEKGLVPDGKRTLADAHWVAKSSSAAAKTAGTTGAGSKGGDVKTSTPYAGPAVGAVVGATTKPAGTSAVAVDGTGAKAPDSTPPVEEKPVPPPKPKKPGNETPPVEVEGVETENEVVFFNPQQNLQLKQKIAKNSEVAKTSTSKRNIIKDDSRTV